PLDEAVGNVAQARELLAVDRVLDQQIPVLVVRLDLLLAEHGCAFRRMVPGVELVLSVTSLGESCQCGSSCTHRERGASAGQAQMGAHERGRSRRQGVDDDRVARTALAGESKA